jgi:hypothetical protein
LLPEKILRLRLDSVEAAEAINNGEDFEFTKIDGKIIQR